MLLNKLISSEDLIKEVQEKLGKKSLKTAISIIKVFKDCGLLNENGEFVLQVIVKADKDKQTKTKELAPSGGGIVWESYKECFVKRYGVEPLRNMKVNSQCKQIYERLGADAPAVIDFYLKHNDGWYLKRQHDIGSLLQAAESLHSQWSRGFAVTSQQVKTFEKQSTNMDLLAKVRKGEV